ncbi:MULTISPECIES: hypothetical protein [unclassified Yoonia]|uniref:hypothetical protein n=1 Tax=unclassified Yoonia TaxID=2629118 RepID=UPI002AFDED3B|nr:MULTISPECIES: hypothetical protein [unclassified Yoonia]
MRQIAQEAADRAVSRVFQNLGVDPNSPDDIFQLRSDIEFLRQARRGTSYGLKTFFSALVAALGMAAWLGWDALIGK